MGLASELFLPRGRATRSQFWNIQMVWMAALALAIWLATLNPNGESWDATRIATTFFFAFVLATGAWSSFCANLRRLHDRGKSGWWILLGCVPIVGYLWLLIDVGFLRGQPEANVYGPVQRTKRF